MTIKSFSGQGRSPGEVLKTKRFPESSVMNSFIHCFSRSLNVFFPCSSRVLSENLFLNKKNSRLKNSLDGSDSHCYHIIRFAQKAPTIQNTHSDRRLLDISHRGMKQKYGKNPGSKKYLYNTLNGDGLVRAPVANHGLGLSLPSSITLRITSILLSISEKDLEKRIEETDGFSD